jgi:glucose-1-phosphate adenylyltransferase
MVPGESGHDGLLINSMLGSGSIIIGATVKHSILSSKV